MRKLIGLILFLIFISSPPIVAFEDSRIQSYDTTYYEDSIKYRQIYINGPEYETYILMRNDSVILYEKEFYTK